MTDTNNLKDRVMRQVGFALEKSWPGVEAALGMMKEGAVA